MPTFEIVKTTRGATSIRDNRVNEIMHNPVGPWEEANALYVEQSKLRARLQEDSTENLVVFDVGLGAAANAIAAMTTCLQLDDLSQRGLHLVSFERDLSLLEFTLQNASAFDHMNGFESAIASVLMKRKWRSPCGRILWELHAEDFLKSIDQEKSVADIIFYDPYSPQVNSEMWTLACFQKLRNRCHPVNAPTASTLYTYSRATPIRAALLLAGFYVGCGTSTGLKPETTQAATQLSALDQPLDARWFLRWQRSHTRFPFGTGSQDQENLSELVHKHPQFN